MNKFKAFFPAIMLTGLFIYAQVTLTGLGREVSKSSKTFASAQVDTVIYNREIGDVAITFGIHTKDSSNFSNAIVRRVIDGVAAPVIAGDTLFSNDSSAADRTITKTITLSPMGDQYWIVVTYKTNTGGLNQGVTTPTVVYEVLKSGAR